MKVKAEPRVAGMQVSLYGCTQSHAAKGDRGEGGLGNHCFQYRQYGKKCANATPQLPPQARECTSPVWSKTFHQTEDFVAPVQ